MTRSTRRNVLGMVSACTAGLLHVRHARAAPEAQANDAGNVCILTPQAEEGPFYVDPRLVRSDVADGKPGVPLTLRLRVIEAGPCTAIAGARVDIWHCDAQGLYSAFRGQGDHHDVDQSGATFLRGTQLTDAAGWVAFNTIYPGWYDGRATHIHFKVFLDEQNVLTGQTYLPDALNEFIYTSVGAYQGRARERAVVNVNDPVVAYSDPERRAFCAVKEERERYLATLTLGVDRRARGATERHRGPPPGPPPGGLADRFPGGGPPWIQPLKDRLAALIPGLKRN